MYDIYVRSQESKLVDFDLCSRTEIYKECILWTCSRTSLLSLDPIVALVRYRIFFMRSRFVVGRSYARPIGSFIVTSERPVSTVVQRPAKWFD